MSILRFSLTVAGGVLSLLSLVAFAKGEVAPHPAADATPSPTPSAILQYSVARLAADPLRARIYATVPNKNSIIVVDTNSLKVIKVIPIGSLPQGLTVSADGRKLWVANSGSIKAAIGVIDLKTLTRLPSLPAPHQPYDIEEGLGHRLYLTRAKQTLPQGAMQVNGDSGAFEGYIREIYPYGFFGVTPDRRTLLSGDRGRSPGTLQKFDISGATASLLQQAEFYSDGLGLSVSHDGELVVYPNLSGQGQGYYTFEIPIADIATVKGIFDVGPDLATAVFSNDDTLLYHGTANQNKVKIFDTSTFNLVGTMSVIKEGEFGTFNTRDLIVDRSGRWLFVATSILSSEPEGDLRVFDTGRDDPLPPPQLANLSTRLNVGQGDNALIGGLIITGNEPKKLMVRAIGPSLTGLGVAGAIEDPVLELHDSEGTVLATNDNWQTTVIGGSIATGQAQQIKNSGLAPQRAAESALIATLPAGAYTAIVRGKDNTTGIGLVETYDLDPIADSKLANISTRGFVEPDPNVMIAGTIVTGNVSARVLVRALGPSLTRAGLSNVLDDPTVELYDSNGVLLSSNDNWRQSQQAEIKATKLAPTRDRESAILATLAPGAYTAIVRGMNDGTGLALVEAYQLAN